MRRVYIVATPGGVSIPCVNLRAALKLAAWLNALGHPASLIRWKLAHRR